MYITKKSIYNSLNNFENEKNKKRWLQFYPEGSKCCSRELVVIHREKTLKHRTPEAPDLSIQLPMNKPEPSIDFLATTGA